MWYLRTIFLTTILRASSIVLLLKSYEQNDFFLFNLAFLITRIIEIYVLHTDIHFSQCPPTCICTWVCPLYGNFIYVSGTVPKVYIYMNVITISDSVGIPPWV